MKIRKIILTVMYFLLISGCKAKEKKILDNIPETQNEVEAVSQDLTEVQEEEPLVNEEPVWLWERDEKYFNSDLAAKSLKIENELSEIVKKSVSEEMNAIDNEYPEDRPTERITRENSYFSNATGHHVIFSDEEIIIVWFSYDNVTGSLKRYCGYKINKDLETITPFCEEA